LSKFTDGVNSYLSDQQQEASAQMSARLLERMLGELSTQRFARQVRNEAGAEFGFEWFNGQYDAPIKLYAVQLAKVRLDTLVRSDKMPKCKIWDMYFDVKRNHNVDTPVGLFFPIPYLKEWIIHNSLTIPQVPGFNYVVRPASDEHNQITVSEYTAFVAGLKRVYEL